MTAAATTAAATTTTTRSTRQEIAMQLYAEVLARSRWQEAQAQAVAARQYAEWRRARRRQRLESGQRRSSRLRLLRHL